jgi:hypothetical protein
MPDSVKAKAAVAPGIECEPAWARELMTTYWRPAK